MSICRELLIGLDLILASNPSLPSVHSLLPSTNFLSIFFFLVHPCFAYLLCVHRLRASCPLDSVSKKCAPCFPDHLTPYRCTQEVQFFPSGQLTPYRYIQEIYSHLSV